MNKLSKFPHARALAKMKDSAFKKRVKAIDKTVEMEYPTKQNKAKFSFDADLNLFEKTRIAPLMERPNSDRVTIK